MTGFQRLFLVTVLATYALIVIGGVVRASESGLGCPDWPLCHGQATPLPQREVLIEYSHRAAALVVSLLVVATAVMAWRRYRSVPSVLVPSLLALALLVAQVLVGGVTVILELPAEVVALHLALAVTLLATLTVGAVASLVSRAAGPASAVNGNGLFGLALVAAVATFGLIVTGAYVTGSDAGLVFSDWPLFNGKVIAEGGRLHQIHFLHRLAAAGGLSWPPWLWRPGVTVVVPRR
jgi:heme A synthase